MRRKTGSRCHVCGGPLGPKWSADHVRPRARGGRDAENNYLPACGTCNGTRWHRPSGVIRRVLRLGTYLLPEIRKKTKLGKAVLEHYRQRRRRNKARRGRSRR
ncbi:MAG: HNH endonuclease [Candidatus Rokubacteria bacterium]|nr:HNH endonuclease [Candidatus Rokubacteria bacterium]